MRIYICYLLYSRYGDTWSDWHGGKNEETQKIKVESGSVMQHISSDMIICLGKKCLPNYTITSPGFPENYGNSIDKTWYIEIPVGQQIVLNFSSFDVEKSTDCQ